MRLCSLDVFRGITIVAMIIVNSPGNHSAYAMLQHSAWDGCTLADLVFPFFIVIAGISSVLALTHQKSKGVSDAQLYKIIMRRSVSIFALGLLLNVLPNHFDLSTLRISGVLQRIALCYFFSSILFLTTSIRVQIILIAVLLMGYWHLILENPFLVSYVDTLILSPQHLYSPQFDPEGLLSTLPAIASALIGNVMGAVLVSSRSNQQKLQWVIGAGLILSALGWIWSIFFPLNKSLWSSSYVLWTGGLSFLIFSSCFALIEIKQSVEWSKPFLLFGKNAMLIYILHIVFLKIQSIILIDHAHGELINLRIYITHLLFGYFSTRNASLCYAMGYTMLWLAVLKLRDKSAKKYHLEHSGYST